MSDTFLPFSRPHISRAAIEEVVACLESGWITTGPRVKKFEEDLAVYLKAPYALTVSSATAGLHLALLDMKLQPGDEVITTPLTFIATLNTIVVAGAKPVLVDIDSSYNIDVNQIEAAISERTRAIIPVHFTGLPADLGPIYALAKKYQLRVIEDAAQAIGGHYKGKVLGSFGDVQIFSFHPNKNITTGEGGCITTRDELLAKNMSVLRFHGIDRQAWDRYGKKGDQRYEVVAPGLKYNMMDIQAALGIHQLAELDSFIERRTQLANRYLDALSNWRQWTLPQIPSYWHRHPWHLFAPLLNPDVAGMNRETFMEKMKEQNIGTGLHYNAAHLYAYYQNHFGFKVGDFPRAEDVCSRIVSLPLFPGMTDADQDHVLAVMKKIFQ